MFIESSSMDVCIGVACFRWHDNWNLVFQPSDAIDRPSPSSSPPSPQTHQLPKAISPI